MADTSNTGKLSTPELLKEITEQMQLLVKSHVDLAKVELKADVKREAKMAAGLGTSAIAGLVAINLLLVTAVLALAAVMPAWAAGLLMSGVVILAGWIVGAIGWRKRVRQPLVRTRHELDRDVTFTKQTKNKLTHERTV